MIKFDQSRLTIEDIVAIAKGNQSVALSDDAEFLAKIRTGSEFLDQLLAEEGVIYGVTTGYGDSCTVSIPADLVTELPRHLYTFHGCGMGEILSPEMGRAVLAARTRLAPRHCERGSAARSQRSSRPWSRRPFQIITTRPPCPPRPTSSRRRRPPWSRLPTDRTSGRSS